MGGGEDTDFLKVIRKETVTVTTLDNYFKDIINDNVSAALMKIDVQGSELNILRGGEKNILPKTNVIILEMSNHDSYSGAAKYFEIDEYLRNHGFTLFGNYCLYVQNKPVKQNEWDSIYINNQLI